MRRALLIHVVFDLILELRLDWFCIQMMYTSAARKERGKGEGKEPRTDVPDVVLWPRILCRFDVYGSAEGYISLRVQ
jgi:hypothetical protein